FRRRPKRADPRRPHLCVSQERSQSAPNCRGWQLACRPWSALGTSLRFKSRGTMVAVVQESDLPGLVRKAVNLFTFLGRTQQLLVKPVRTVDKFEKALWLGDLPEHPAVHSAHRAANPDV